MTPERVLLTADRLAALLEASDLNAERSLLLMLSCSRTLASRLTINGVKGCNWLDMHNHLADMGDQVRAHLDEVDRGKGRP